MTDRWVSLFIFVSPLLEPDLSNSFLYRLLANNTVHGTTELVYWLAGFQSRYFNGSCTYSYRTFRTSHSTLPGLCRIPTENTVENYFSKKLFHYKLIGPTSLTIKMMIDPTNAWLWTNRKATNNTVSASWSARFLRGAKLLFFSLCWDWQQRTDQEHQAATIDRFADSS